MSDQPAEAADDVRAARKLDGVTVDHLIYALQSLTPVRLTGTDDGRTP